MRITVLMIKWCSAFSFLFLILTYLFSVHVKKYPQNSFFSEIWLSDDFLISICSGVFASLLVVILCEISRYRSLKINVEQRIYDTNVSLFITLSVMKKAIEDCIDNKEVVKDDFLDFFVEKFKKEKNELDSIDYTTFWNSKNSLATKYILYKAELSKQKIWDAGFKLKIVMHDIHKQYSKSSSSLLYTPVNPAIKDVLNKILDNVNLIFSTVDCFNKALDNSCTKRFQWQNLKDEYRKSGCSMPQDDNL